MTRQTLLKCHFKDNKVIFNKVLFVNDAII